MISRDQQTSACVVGCHQLLISAEQHTNSPTCLPCCCVCQGPGAGRPGCVRRQRVVSTWLCRSLLSGHIGVVPEPWHVSLHCPLIAWTRFPRVFPLPVDVCAYCWHVELSKSDPHFFCYPADEEMVGPHPGMGKLAFYFRTQHRNLVCWPSLHTTLCCSRGVRFCTNPAPFYLLHVAASG